MATRRITALLSTTAGVVLAVVLVTTLRLDEDSSAPTPATGNAPVEPALLDPDAPLGPEGMETTVDTAVRTGPVPVFRPQTELASDATIDRVWLRSVGIPEVYIRYTSGLEVSVRPADFSMGFEAFYRGEIEQGYPGYLTEIGGVSVFVNPGTTEGSLPGADLVVDEMLVELIGRGSFSEEDVVVLVESLLKSTSAT